MILTNFHTYTHEKLCVRTYDRTYAGTMWKQLGSLLGNNAPTALKERKAKRVKAVVKGKKLLTQGSISFCLLFSSSFSYLLVFFPLPFPLLLFIFYFFLSSFTITLLFFVFGVASSLIFFFPSG